MKAHTVTRDSLADAAGQQAKHYVDLGVDVYNSAADKTRAASPSRLMDMCETIPGT